MDYERKLSHYFIIVLLTFSLIGFTYSSAECFEAPGKPIEGEPTPVVEVCI